MFGHDSEPTRLYSYGAKVPIEGAQTVDRQMELARRYRNAHVRVERDRRERVEAALHALSPVLVEIDDRIDAATFSLLEARGAINRASAMAREKVFPPGTAAAANAAVELLGRLYKERKAIRQELFASPAWEPIGAAIDGRANVRGKRLYAAIGRMGLGWGTRLHIGTTVKRSGAPPQFSHRDGGGHLAVQVQHGISPAEAFAGQDTRIRIEPLPVEPPEDFIGPRLSKAAMKRTVVSLRVGSEGRDPVFAIIPVVLHRPMPWDAQIKWVHLIRRRIGLHCEWRVQFALSRVAGWDPRDRATDGQIAIDVGWRVTGDDGKTPRPDGSMRVAYWKGSDGAEGEITLPADWLSEMRKTEHIQSVRDEELFNPMRERLAERLEGTPGVPQWLRDRTSTLPQWKSQARLAKLAIDWRSNRFDGDGEIFTELEAWRKRDKHLLEYAANLRDQLHRRREDIFRNFAAWMRRTYQTAKVEFLDLRDFHRNPKAEEPVPDGALKEHVRDACISALFRCIEESMARTVKVPAKNTTARCHVCGSLQTWNRKILRHRCTACGAEWDQDENASVNIGVAVSGKVL